MSDFANITLNGKPLSEVLRQQRLNDVENHFASEEASIRRNLARGRATPLPLAAAKRGRKPIEVRYFVRVEIQSLAADESLSIEEIARQVEQPVRIVRLCLRRFGNKRKGGRKKITTAQQ